MAKQVRLGIIGLPAQGSMYARLITDGIVPNMDIGAICEPNPAMAEVTGSTYPGVGFHVDSLTMLDSGDVDAVVICVPSLPASGDGYRRAAARHPRSGREAGRHIHETGARA
jgi:predicted dehydrogenase